MIDIWLLIHAGIKILLPQFFWCSLGGHLWNWLEQNHNKACHTVHNAFEISYNWNLLHGFHFQYPEIQHKKNQ